MYLTAASERRGRESKIAREWEEIFGEWYRFSARLALECMSENIFTGALNNIPMAETSLRTFNFRRDCTAGRKQEIEQLLT